MINIDQLRYYYEKPFLDLIEGIEKCVHHEDTHRTLYYKDNEWYFLWNKNTNLLVYDDIKVCSFLKETFLCNRDELELIIKKLMKKHLNLVNVSQISANIKIDVIKWLNK